MKSIHTEIHTNEKGLKEIKTYEKYYFNEETGEVTLVTSESVDNPYPGGIDKEDEEISREVLEPNKIPKVVRDKIEELLNK